MEFLTKMESETYREVDSTIMSINFSLGKLSQYINYASLSLANVRNFVHNSNAFDFN